MISPHSSSCNVVTTSRSIGVDSEVLKAACGHSFRFCCFLAPHVIQNCKLQDLTSLSSTCSIFVRLLDRWNHQKKKKPKPAQLQSQTWLFFGIDQLVLRGRAFGTEFGKPPRMNCKPSHHLVSPILWDSFSGGVSSSHGEGCKMMATFFSFLLPHNNHITGEWKIFYRTRKVAAFAQSVGSSLVFHWRKTKEKKKKKFSSVGRKMPHCKQQKASRPPWPRVQPSGPRSLVKNKRNSLESGKTTWGA